MIRTLGDWTFHFEESKYGKYVRITHSEAPKYWDVTFPDRPTHLDWDWWNLANHYQFFLHYFEMTQDEKEESEEYYLDFLSPLLNKTCDFCGDNVPDWAECLDDESGREECDFCGETAERGYP